MEERSPHTAMDEPIDIFISYAKEDRSRVEALVTLFEAQEWRVWWDTDIPPGKTWREIIEQAVERARCIVVVWSKTSATKPWVQAEADEGLRRGILLPVMIEETKIPLGFRHIQAVNLTQWNGAVEHTAARRMIQAVKTLLTGPDTTITVVAHNPSNSSEQVGTSARGTSIRRFRPVISGIVFACSVVLLISGLILYRSWRTARLEAHESSNVDVTGDVTIAGLPREITGKDSVPMVLVPAGEFRMGSTWAELEQVLRLYPGISRQWLEDEVPQHRVYLDSYYIDKFEVTTAQYRDFLAMSNRPPPKFWEAVDLQVHGRRPVAGVTWYDAQAYCKAYGKRLPTEAEWEKAARGKDAREYPWGNERPSPQHANFDRCCEWKGYGTYTAVGTYQTGKSQYGAYDLAGNVWEWVADEYDPMYYRKSPERNPQGPDGNANKVERGGSWNYPAHELRAAWRGKDPPDKQDRDVGFRCAQDATSLVQPPAVAEGRR